MLSRGGASYRYTTIFSGPQRHRGTQRYFPPSPSAAEVRNDIWHPDAPQRYTHTSKVAYRFCSRFQNCFHVIFPSFLCSLSFVLVFCFRAFLFSFPFLYSSSFVFVFIFVFVSVHFRCRLCSHSDFCSFSFSFVAVFVLGCFRRRSLSCSFQYPSMFAFIVVSFRFRSFSFPFSCEL